MCTLVPPPFVLTPEEALHVRYYVWDVVCSTGPDYIPGPACDWLWDHDIFPTTMLPFQLAAQRSIMDWYTWLDEAPPAPFKAAWQSKEEFEARAWEAVGKLPRNEGVGFRPPRLPSCSPGEQEPGIGIPRNRPQAKRPLRLGAALIALFGVFWVFRKVICLV